MRIDAVVVNASPLIALFRSAQADLLPGLFARIVVPEAVWREVVLEGHDDSAATGLAGQSWPIREDVTVSPRVAAWNLGAGESSVLSYALAHSPLRAVIDDTDARRCARTLGIPILGTGGVILLAKRRGLIDSVTTRLNRLRDAGLWISDGLVELLRKQAGE
jgi:predicted nucleic acid-binding protein